MDLNVQHIVDVVQHREHQHVNVIELGIRHHYHMQHQVKVVIHVQQRDDVEHEIMEQHVRLIVLLRQVMVLALVIVESQHVVMELGVLHLIVIVIVRIKLVLEVIWLVLILMVIVRVVVLVVLIWLLVI